jgi:hypothetical protein
MNLTLRYNFYFVTKQQKTAFLKGSLKVTIILKTLVEEYILFSILGTKVLRSTFKVGKAQRDLSSERFFIYNVFHKKSKTVQIRVSKRGDKRSTRLIGLGELFSYAMSYSAQ